MEQLTRGFSPGQHHQGNLFAESLFHSVVYVSFQSWPPVSHIAIPARPATTRLPTS
jgi:hypothetical protein